MQPRAPQQRLLPALSDQRLPREEANVRYIVPAPWLRLRAVSAFDAYLRGHITMREWRSLLLLEAALKRAARST